MTPLRELQLVEAHRGGGPAAHEAIGELVRAYQRRIYSVCLRMVRNPDDASDLTQDVLVKLIENLGSYNGQSKLSTWVIRVAMNCCLSHLRKQKVRTHKPLGTPSGVWSDSPVTPEERAIGPRAEEPSPPESVEHSQKRSAVLQALDGLEVEARAILVLRDLHDLDYQQLAEVLEVPLGTVKSRLFRARASLRQAIEAQGGL